LHYLAQTFLQPSSLMGAITTGLPISVVVHSSRVVVVVIPNQHSILIFGLHHCCCG
jgi:hypothetical protein